MPLMTSDDLDDQQVKLGEELVGSLLHEHLLQLYYGGRIIYRLPNIVNLCKRSQNAYVRGAGVFGFTSSSTSPIAGQSEMPIAKVTGP